MTLAALLEGVAVSAVSGPTDREVTGMSADSRRVGPGTLFFALAGAREDGARYAAQALAAGAVGIVVAHGTSVARAGSQAVVEVEEPRKAMAQSAARFHGHPERALRVVGVTGTNGKTTTTWMLESIFRAAGWKAGVIGTTGVRIGDEQRPAALTTPDSPELFGLLHEMVEHSVEAVAIEVSSHALVQHRTFGLACEVAIFTNLTQDHLDYHGTMDRYLDAKLMLFDGRNGPIREHATAAINADDPNGKRVVTQAASSGFTVRTFSTDEKALRRHSMTPEDVDLYVASVRAGADGLDLSVIYNPHRGSTGFLGTPHSEPEFNLGLPLLGRHNASNAAAAMITAITLGIDQATIVRGLESMPAVPGRLESVDAAQPFLVVVDYAHTPDALERALAAAREHAAGRVLLVFGCGGDRDRGKRPEMGRIAAERADQAWVTSDNPRGEDPAAIVADIVAGAAERSRLEVELDRRAAIGKAIAAARPGDAVVIAGKGHETTQTIGTRILPFDDRIVAREALAARAAGGVMMGFATTPVLTLPEIARMVGGDLVARELPAGAAGREAFLKSGMDGVSIDTRTLSPGQLFVPLRGGNTDGHRFLAEAFARGAALAFCERARYAEWEGREPGPLVVVNDATAALQHLAARFREAWSGLLIGVTGSAGKTTTKDLVAAVLATAAPTLKTEGNLNNHWGVPLTLLRLRPEHRSAVVEIAMNRPGEIVELAQLARPEAAVITNAGSAHLEGVGSLEGIAREKASLASVIPAGQPVFAGADSPRLMTALRALKVRIVSYGLAAGAMVRPESVTDLGPEGTRFTVAGFPPVHLRLVGRHQVANALAALAVAREYKVDPAAAVRAIAAQRPARGRMETRTLRGATLLVDCYNANPDSMRAALETLAGWPGATRRIAVLGDMLELGPVAGKLHREAGAAARGAELWTTGAHAADYAAGAKQAGVEAHVFPDKASLAAALEHAVAPGAVVLIKASHGAAFDELLVRLGAEG